MYKRQGLGWPVLARWSPVEPSWIKLLLFASLLSPVLACALYLLLRAVLDAQGAVAATLLAAAPLGLLARGLRTRFDPPGRAALLALGLALASGAVVAAMVLRGTAPRVSYHGLLHSGILLAVDRSVPPENPWLADTPLALSLIHI